jgi:serine/threonine protein kinase
VNETRVNEVLRQLASRPPAQWEAALEKRFPDDPALVQQALLWLHAEHDAESEALRPSLGEIGDERYVLTVKLDQGATSSVWQAYDRKLARNVAIKILRAGGDDRVIAEARAACDVISDHVVRILDVHDGEPRYIVMELVGEHDPDRDQLTLGTAASECAPRDVHEVVSWVMRVARGLHDAHLRNVFHRDLKPRNVLITPISRKARIADFGLAVSAGGEESTSLASPLIRSGPDGPIAVQGTPEYMAPEQARGLPIELDPRLAADRAALIALDVWGLGALAYALLAGRGPWGPRGSGLAAWDRAAEGAAPPPLERTPWGERIPRRLRRIVGKAMAIEPTARYASAAQVANELEAFLAQRPTSFDRARSARLALWARRNPQLTITAIAAVVLVLLTLGTRMTVARLRRERDSLKVELADQESELHRLNDRVDRSRAELAETEAELHERAADLTALQASVEDERHLHETVLQAKDRDLRDATAATRHLVEDLEAARGTARAIEAQRAKYEGYWKSAQREIERVTKERDRARQDRDASRADLDRLERELDAAIADRDAARRALADHQAAKVVPDRDRPRPR